MNAAEAATLACAALVRQSGAITVIVPTVSGKTATQLAKISPCAIILTVSTNPEVAKKLVINKGIITIIYDSELKTYRMFMNSNTPSIEIVDGNSQFLLSYYKTFEADIFQYLLHL